MVILRV